MHHSVEASRPIEWDMLSPVHLLHGNCTHTTQELSRIEILAAHTQTGVVWLSANKSHTVAKVVGVAELLDATGDYIMRPGVMPHGNALAILRTVGIIVEESCWVSGRFTLPACPCCASWPLASDARAHEIGCASVSRGRAVRRRLRAGRVRSRKPRRRRPPPASSSG
jgi:hypothetical protein